MGDTTPSDPLRVSVDTSVIGGCFDTKFATHSLRFFALARSGRIIVLVSEVVVRELEGAPEEVKGVLTSLPPSSVEIARFTDEAIDLVAAYISAGVVGARWIDDARHVAVATIARADAVASWNFKHMVRLDRIRAYNDVNQRKGYPPVTILSPMEVTYDDE